MQALLAFVLCISADAPMTRDTLLETLDRGFGMALKDDWLSGNVGVVLRPRLGWSPSPSTTPVLSLNMTRPQLRVSAWQKRIKLFIQPEFSEPVRILDAEVLVQPWDFFGVRVGRFVTSFSRSFATPVPRLKFPDFAAANTFFRADRDVGASVLGSFFGKRLDYDIGVFSGGSLLPGPLDRGLVMVLARVSGSAIDVLTLDENQCKNADCPLRLGFGVNAYYRALEARELRADGSIAALGVERQGAAGVDFGLTWGLVQVQGELYYRARFFAPVARVDQLGAYLHASVALVPSWLEVAVRGDFVDPNLRGGSDHLYAFDGLLTAYLLGEHAKVWLQYSYRWLNTYAPRPIGWANAHEAHQLLLQLQVWL